MLRNAGFTRIRTVGSHSVWSKGQTTVSLPDGHRRISPGVFRQVEKAIEEALP